MKLLSTLSFLFFSFLIHAQTITVTMAGIGDIKLGMKQAEVERLLNRTLKLPHTNAGNDDYYQDTVHITYKGLDADLIFQRDYIDDKKYTVNVYEIRSSNPLIRTRSGIGIGDDKYKIIRAYEGYTIWIMPEYENNDRVKSKTRSSVWLHGDDGGLIIFYLDNNRVTGMSVTYEEGD
jgi:hypothetical protein